jgi:diguanylate cyclase (GGDEF)-like protein
MGQRATRGDQTERIPLTDQLPPQKRPCIVVIAGTHLGQILPIDGELTIGRDAEVTLQLADDEHVSPRHARVIANDEGATLSDLGSEHGTFVSGVRVAECTLEDGAKFRIGQTAVLKFARYDSVEEQAQRQLYEAALRDGLTHAFNRRYFHIRIASEIHFAERHKHTLAVLLIDIDHFKPINDRTGHLAGDDVLVEVARALAECLRDGDTLARYGGDEFAVILREVDVAAVCAVAERLRSRIEELPAGVTISIGIAGFPLDAGAGKVAEKVKKLLERADQALYRAKSRGRNRVEV